MGKAREAFPRGDVTAYDSTLGWRFVNPRMEALYGTHPLGETAELVAEKYDVTREAQDAFALESQRRWAAAQAAGRFADELCAVEVPARGKGKPAKRVEVDEHPRPETTAGRAGGADAGVSQAGRDGDGGQLVGDQRRRGGACCSRREAGLKRLGRPAARALRRVGASRASSRSSWGSGRSRRRRRRSRGPGSRSRDLDLVELNEAFAAQAIPCVRELGFDPARVNVNGGAIAIGHPLGASGARLVTTLVHELGAAARPLRAGDDVHRRRAGDRRHLRARMTKRGRSSGQQRRRRGRRRRSAMCRWPRRRTRSRTRSGRSR